MKENKQIASKIMKGPRVSVDPDALESQAKAARTGRRTVQTSTTDQIAGDKFFYKNWGIRAIQLKYPEKRFLWYCEKYYPYAKPCPMFFDEPHHEWEIKECQEKAEVMKELGLKYAYVTSDMHDGEIYEQLGIEPGESHGLDNRSA